jgi:hypothetical protein
MKVICVVKIGENRFAKWRCTNLRSFERFLDDRFSGWRFYNVYDNKTREQIASYTCKKRFTSSH